MSEVISDIDSRNLLNYIYFFHHLRMKKILPFDKTKKFGCSLFAHVWHLTSFIYPHSATVSDSRKLEFVHTREIYSFISYSALWSTQTVYNNKFKNIFMETSENKINYQYGLSSTKMCIL